MRRGEIMRRVRAQALMVKQLSEQLGEMSTDGVRSLQPGGTAGARRGASRGLEVQMERREALERILERESAMLRIYEKEARQEMDGMSQAEYTFCVLYYIGGREMRETSLMMNRSIRQCERYRSGVEE